MYRTRYSLAALAAAGLLLPACRSSLDRIDDFDPDGETAVPGDIRLAEAPAGFDFATTAARELEIRAVDPDGAQAVDDVGVSLWIPGAADTLVLLARGRTDATGTWRPSVALATDVDSVTLRVEHVGYPEAHRIALAPAGVSAYTLGAANAGGRVVPDAIVDQTDVIAREGEGGPDGAARKGAERAGATSAGKLGRRGADFAYLGTYDAQGVPDYLTTAKTIWPDVVDFIAVNLPDQHILNHRPDYLDERYDPSLIFREEGELWVSFAHEGAGYRNAFGYFTYDLDDPPSSRDEVPTRNIVFPNVSYAGSGGGLQRGDRVYLGRIPANTGVCFFLVPDGFDPGAGAVVDQRYTRYSIDDLNQFFWWSRAYRRHNVLLANELREFLVLGFEDLVRPWGDNDFNDAVFIVEPEPWSSVDVSRTPPAIIYGSDQDDDGVADFRDNYPFDPERAFDTYAPAEGNFGTVAFEDMWPHVGDYDFNDLVVDYNVHEVLAANEKIKDLRISLRVRALGATQKHGFAFQLPISPQGIESVTGQVLGSNAVVTLNPNGTETGMRSAVIPAFTNAFELLGTRQGLINTVPDSNRHAPYDQELVITFVEPVDRKGLGRPPYDAFLIRGGVREQEIHMAGFPPTEKADLATFNTKADASDAATGEWYVDANNLPWALHLPNEFQYPRERARIDEVYTNFVEWAVYGGTVADGWWRPGDGNIDEGKAY